MASARVVTACSLLLLLVAATLLVSARTAIGPLLQSAAEARGEARAARVTGAVVYALPDGIYCRQVAFNNITAEIREGEMRLCRDSITRIRLRPRPGLAWHAQ